MRALELVVDGLADVMQQAGALGQRHVGAQLRGHQAGQVGHLDGVLEHVLAVARAVSHAAQELDQFVVDAVHVGLKDRLLAGLADLVVHLAAGLLDHFLDAGRMDAAVGNELLQRDARDLAANRVERGDDDRLRRVVDDQVDAGRGFQRADVAALAADDAALHVLVGQGDDGHGRLGDVIGGAALNRHRDDVARLLVRLVLRVLLDLADHHAGVVERFLLDALHDHVLRFLLRHLGDALQLHALLLLELARSLLSGFRGSLLADGVVLRLLRQAVKLRLLALERRLARVEVVGLLVKGLLTLGDAALAALHLGAAAVDLAVQLVLEADDLFLRLDDLFLLLLLSTALRVVEQVAGVLLRTADLLFLNVLAIDIANCQADDQGSQYGQNGQKNRQSISHSFFDKLFHAIISRSKV